MKKYSKVLQNFFLYGVFVLYVIILYMFLLETSKILDPNREIYRSVNLIPLHSIITFYTSENGFAFGNVFGNIILFIPLGIYLPLFKCDKKTSLYLIWIFFISFVVELIQYILGIGICDIDDIILNTLGGLIGVVIYKFLFHLIKDKNKTRFIIMVIGTIVAIPVLFLLTQLKIRIR